MKNIICFILLITYTTIISAQYSKEYGKFNEADATLEIYPKDEDADAVILFDRGQSEFITTDNGFDIKFVRTKRIKILKKSGIDRAEVSIPYYVEGHNKSERVRNIKAVTYNRENGGMQKTELDKNTIFEEQKSNNWKMKKFVFPDVKVGSIIEYKYELVTPFIYNLPDWTFQDNIPTVYSEYKASMIPFYDYVYLAQGLSKFDGFMEKQSPHQRSFANVNFNDYTFTYIMEDVAAFKDESYISSVKDYIMKIDFQLAKFTDPTGYSEEVISTWASMIESLLKHFNFGKYITSSQKLARKILPTLELDGKSNLEKSKIIIDYVKSNFNWNETNGKYANVRSKEFLQTKIGTASDINLFLIGMLKEAGIEAEPVILSTRSHGKVNSDYPFSHFFNYVALIVTVDEGTFLTDGTDELVAFNRMPIRCANGKGLIIKEGEEQWIDLATTAMSKLITTSKITLDPENLSAKVTSVLQSMEFEALRYKYKYQDDTEKIKEGLIDSGFESIEKIKTSKYDKPNIPYIIALEGTTKTESLAGKILIRPFLNFPIQENNLKQKVRSYPVDFIYPYLKNYKTTITIPEGYKVLELPESFNMDNDLASINITYEIRDNVVEVLGSYSFKSSIYPSTKYSRIKKYFDDIIEKFNQELVFEKI